MKYAYNEAIKTTVLKYNELFNLLDFKRYRTIMDTIEPAKAMRKHLKQAGLFL